MARNTTEYIKDLATLIKNRDKQTSSEATFDAVLSTLGYLEGQKSERKVENRNTFDSLVKMLDGVTTSEGMVSYGKEIDNLLVKSETDPELHSQATLLKSMHDNNREDYEMYKGAIDSGLSYLANDKLPDTDEEWLNFDKDENLGAFALEMGQETEDGSPDILRFITEQKNKVNGYLDKISLGYDGKNRRFSYKGKDADAAAEVKRKEAYNQNVRAWTQMQNFAQEMPFGQQANFLRKQLDTLPQDLIESQNLDKFIDNYGLFCSKRRQS